MHATSDRTRTVARLAAVLTVSGLAAAASAQVFADQYDYLAGTTLQGQVSPGFNFDDYDLTGAASPGTGFEANVPTVVSGSLSPVAGGLPSSGNKVAFGPTAAGGTSNRALRITPLPSPGIQSGSVWYSVLFRVTEAAPLSATDQGNYAFALNNGAEGSTDLPTVAGARLQVRATRGVDDDASFQIGLFNADAAFGNPTVFTEGQTILAVLEYQIVAGAGNDVTNLYINPDVTTGTAPAMPFLSRTGDDITTTTNGIRSLIVARQVGSTPFTEFDDLRLGTTFASVTGPVVPEPTTLAAVAGAGLLALRRRRA